MLTYIIMSNLINSNQKRIPFTLKRPVNPWVIPDGFYRAKVKSVTSTPPTPSTKDDQLREIKIVFDVFMDSERDPMSKLAKVSYTEGESGYDDIHNTVAALYSASEAQEILEGEVEINLADLEGRQADIEITTFKKDGHKDPYSAIYRVARAGTLIDDFPQYIDREEVSMSL
jgi:hypothetical protein